MDFVSKSPINFASCKAAALELRSLFFTAVTARLPLQLGKDHNCRLMSNYNRKGQVSAKIKA